MRLLLLVLLDHRRVKFANGFLSSAGRQPSGSCKPFKPRSHMQMRLRQPGTTSLSCIGFISPVRCSQRARLSARLMLSLRIDQGWRQSAEMVGSVHAYLCGGQGLVITIIARLPVVVVTVDAVGRDAGAQR